jgi:hypothetical protein
VVSHEEKTEGLGHLLNAQAGGGSHQDVDPGHQPRVPQHPLQVHAQEAEGSHLLQRGHVQVLVMVL